MLGKVGDALVHFVVNARNRFPQFLFRNDKVLGRIDARRLELLQGRKGDGVDVTERLDFVSPQPDAERVFFVGEPDIDRIAPHAKGAAFERGVFAVVLDIDELGREFRRFDNIADFENNGEILIVFRRAQTVDAAYACDDNNVVAAHERTGRREAHAVDLVVNGRIFFDIDIRLRNIGFRLIVVVIADEIRDGVVRKERFKFFVELSRERFIMREYERRTLQLLNDVCHRKRFSGPRYAHERLAFRACAESVDELLDRLRLISRRFKRFAQFKH